MITLETLTRDPANRDQHLPLMPLLLLRGGQSILLPDLATPLAPDDRLLFCGKFEARAAHPLLLCNLKSLTYALDGLETPDGVIWRWLTARRHKAALRR